jgi:hypothetical protein|tara:strand:+ start:184 stop:561 length:378 start_codon:yes stop_codon:yes gene_type:complete
MKCLILLFIISAFGKSLNLSGNSYKATIKVPIIRDTQELRLDFISQTKATIQFKGFINNKGSIIYHYNDEKDNFVYILDDNLQQIIDKYYLSLYDISYDELKCAAYVTIKSRILQIKQKICFTLI